jgi:hypothetical protein
MSLTKLSLAGINKIIPGGRVCLVTSRLGTGKIVSLFYSVHEVIQLLQDLGKILSGQKKQGKKTKKNTASMSGNLCFWTSSFLAMIKQLFSFFCFLICSDPLCKVKRRRVSWKNTG